MDLNDGLVRYKFHNIFYDWALQLEIHAQLILSLLRKYERYPPLPVMGQTKNFLVDIEKWKAGCLHQRMGNAIQNSEQAIWDAFREAHYASNDIAKIQSIMQLKGFGSAIDDETGLRRAKVATSVLRFFWPEHWGVVDWRTAAILGLIKKQNWDIDKALSRAKGIQSQEFRSLYDLIDEYGACDIIENYRLVSAKFPEALPRAADVDMALFGLSLWAWS